MPDNMLIEKPEPLKPETSTPKVEKKFKPEDMKKDVIKWVTDSRTHYADRFKMVDEYVKRYEAKRSISGLMGWGDDPQRGARILEGREVGARPEREVVESPGRALATRGCGQGHGQHEQR